MHVDSQHAMHRSMARRLQADLRWQAHSFLAKRATARSSSNFVPRGCKRALGILYRCTPKWLLHANDSNVCENSLSSAIAGHCGQCTRLLPGRAPVPPGGSARHFGPGKPLFFGKAYRCDCECLSSGATHLLQLGEHALHVDVRARVDVPPLEPLLRVLEGRKTQKTPKLSDTVVVPL